MDIRNSRGNSRSRQCLDVSTSCDGRRGSWTGSAGGDCAASIACAIISYSYRFLSTPKSRQYVQEVFLEEMSFYLLITAMVRQQHSS